MTGSFRGRRRVRRFAVGAVAAAAIASAVVLPAESASAHDVLIGSTPAGGSTVTAPARVDLRFDNAVLGGTRGSTALIVTGPGRSGRHFEAACPTVRDRTVSAAVRLGAPGRYTVTYRVVSADGHPVSATFAFVTRTSGGGSGSASGPDCGVTVSGPVQQGRDTSGWVIGGIAGGVALLAIVGAVVAVVIRPRREA